MTLTTPLSGTVCRQQAGTCYGKPTHRIWSVSLHPLWKYERRRKMSKIGWFEVVRGHPRSLKIAPFDIWDEFLLAFRRKYAFIWLHFWYIARYWSKNADVNLPHLYLAPPLGWPVMSLEFRRYFWHRKTRVPGPSYGVLSVILCLAIFVQLRLVTDRRTDRQTDGRTDRQADDDS